jgi:hypothetical protein
VARHHQAVGYQGTRALKQLLVAAGCLLRMLLLPEPGLVERSTKAMCCWLMCCCMGHQRPLLWVVQVTPMLLLCCARWVLLPLTLYCFVSRLLL